MRIAVNTRLLLNNKLDGIGWFTYQILKRLTQNNPNVHFVFIFDRPYDDGFIFSDNITPIIIAPQARHPFLYYTWFHWSVKNLLNQLKPNLFLSPDGFLSPGAKCKQLAVIHDINFFHNPQDLKWLTSKYYNYFFHQYAHIANRIATVSEYSKQDIKTNFKIDPNKIDVVYNGINEDYQTIAEIEKQNIKNTFALGCDYFLFVGSQSPRKNLVRLIQAFEQFKKNTNAPIKLVFVGAVCYQQNQIFEAINNSQYATDIIFLGRQPQAELIKIMGAAFALTYVPTFEGFGIPLVEAMSAGVPIICSNTTSMPEIVNDAALLVNPFNTEEIAQALAKIYTDKTLRIALIEKGTVQKNKFSWDKSANLLWSSILKTHE